jgi:hypothetical protein
MTWNEQLLTKKWLTKRTEILIRDHFKCQVPGCDVEFEGVEVHHLDYLGNLLAWEYPNDMLKTLCHKHHSNHHQGIQMAEKALMSSLRVKGFLLGDVMALSSLVDTDIEFTQSLLKILSDLQNGKKVHSYGNMG